MSVSSRVPVDLDDGLGEGLRSFLRHVVADALQDAVRIPARKHVRIGLAVRRRTVEVAGARDRGHGDDWPLEELRLQLVVPRLAGGKAEPPAVVVDDDADVIRVVEGRRGAIVGGVVEVPLWRGERPDELVEFAPVLAVALAAAFGG